MGMPGLLADSIACIHSRRFYGAAILPLPSYIFYFLGGGVSEYALRTIGFVIGTMGSILAMKACTAARRRHSSLHTCIYMGLSMLIHLLTQDSGNDRITVLFASLFFYGLSKESGWVESVAFGAMISSDLFCIIFVPLLLWICVRRLFFSLVNPQNGWRIMLRDIVRFMLQAAVVPLTIFTLAIILDLYVRDLSSPHASEYSLEYQASLKEFNIRGKISKYDEGHAVPRDTAVDLYVMDRSVVSVINRKHRSFVAHKRATGAEELLFEIQKVHDEEFDGEENRFIRDGDTVKLKLLSSDAFLGLVDKKDESKFINASFKSFADDNDFWKVKCDGYLQARAMAVEFIHSNTGLVLCCTRPKNDMLIYGSAYSDKKSRLFYIVDNRIHPYFKAHFEDPRVHASVEAFPRLSFARKFLEYLKSIKAQQEDLFLVFGARPGSSEQLARFIGKLFVLSFAASLLSSATLFLNYVCSRRYARSLRISNSAYALCSAFFLNILGSFMIRVHGQMLLATCLSFNFFMVQALLSNLASRPVALLNKKAHRLKR